MTEGKIRSVYYFSDLQTKFPLILRNYHNSESVQYFLMKFGHKMQNLILIKNIDMSFW